MPTVYDKELADAYDAVLNTPPPLEAAEYVRQVLRDRPPRRKRVLSMRVTVTAVYEPELTRDHVAKMGRYVDGTVAHDPGTGELTLSWRVSGERVLGVASTAPRIASQAFMAAFGFEPEVVSMTVSHPDRH